MAAFLNLLGFTMAGPITPDLGKHFAIPVGAKFGSLTSAYPLGMLVGLFLWPQLSDRIGRKPVITTSLLGSGVGLATQAIAIKRHWSLQAFLVTRIVTGWFAGSSPVSKAFLADVGAEQGKLPRYLALRDAASTMAFIVGPMFGGLLFDLRRRFWLGHHNSVGGAAAAAEAAAEATGVSGSLAFVIGASAAASLAAGALVALLVRELPSSSSRNRQQQQSGSEAELEQAANTQQPQEEIISCPLGVRLWTGVATVCVVSFLFNVGDSTFHAFFPSILRDKLQLNAQSIGLAYTCLACLSFSVSATLSSRCIQNIGVVKTCSLGLSAAAMGLMSLSKAASPVTVLGAAALYYCGVPFYGPTVPAMLLRCVPTHKRGAVMGLDGAINTMGRVVSPLIMGELYRRHNTAAFAVAGIAVMTGSMLALVRRVMVVQRKRSMKPDDPIIVVQDDRK